MQTRGDVKQTNESLKDDRECLDRDCKRALAATPDCLKVRVILRLPPTCKWDPRSSAMFRSVYC